MLIKKYNFQMSETRDLNVAKKEEKAITHINIFPLKLIIFAYSLTLIKEFTMLYIENRNEFAKLKENSPLGFWILIIMIITSKIIKKCCFESFFCSMILYFLYIVNNNEQIMQQVRFFLCKFK